MIQIKLPNQGELANLIEKKLEANPQITHNLLDFDRYALAKLMGGYSPFDLDRVISKVLVQKISEFKKGLFYKLDKKGYYFLCKETDKGSAKMTYAQVRKNPLKLPIITLDDLKKALKTIQPTNEKDCEEQYKAFCKKNRLPV
jgi:SpoVK/Ycf46/Vps4 family AAA+-type ATPase